MSHLEKAYGAWGDAIPDWIIALAGRTDVTSLSRVAREIGYSAATISYVIGNRYPGDLAKVEERIRASLMDGEIACPELGRLALAQCLEWRAKAGDFQPTSTLRRVMYHACRACPHNGGGQNHAE